MQTLNTIETVYLLTTRTPQLTIRSLPHRLLVGLFILFSRVKHIYLGNIQI
jgi:hypothetical protein